MKVVFLLLHEFKKTVIRISRYVFFMIFFYLMGIFSAVSKAAFLAIKSSID